MLTLTTDQIVAAAPDYAVVAGGDYAPTAMVECYRLAAPAQVVAFSAKFIATGEQLTTEETV